MDEWIDRQTHGLIDRQTDQWNDRLLIARWMDGCMDGLSIIGLISEALTTPFSHITDMRSSTPLTPFGILVKSSFPRAFWHTENVQLSVPVTLRSSL